MNYYNYDGFGVYTDTTEEPGMLCTEAAPPTAPAGQVAVFNGEAWVLMTDIRGDWYTGNHEKVFVEDPRVDVSKCLRTPPPSLGYKAVEGAWVEDTAIRPALETADIKAKCEDIDQRARDILLQFSPLRGVYLEREKQANEFKANNYAGTVPDYIAMFATPAQMTAQAATDLIITQSAQLRYAEKMLETTRQLKQELSFLQYPQRVQRYNQIVAQIKVLGNSLK